MSLTVRTILATSFEGILIDVECHLSNGLPTILIVGLGNKAVDEAKERIRSAFATKHLLLPRKRITINLAPADIPKESTSLDLAIALAILQASGQIAHIPDEKTAAIGELGLNGEVRPVRGIIGKLLAAKRLGITKFFVPAGNMEQAALVSGVELTGINDIYDLYQLLNNQSTWKIVRGGNVALPRRPTQPTHAFSEISGQLRAKRALQIAAAGGHNILLSGPPGTGKTMLAKALHFILPPVSADETLEITHLHSLVNGNYDKLVTARPFRAPHHSASHIAMVGGGNLLRPGEISLAHRGVLFMDEFPEFERKTIEALRQPLEEQNILISRAKETVKYPANFILVATANPCPCGYYGTDKPCECAPHAIQRYRQKLSGPIMDRIDLYVNVEPVEHKSLLHQSADTEQDEILRKQIASCRAIQLKRFGSKDTRLNTDMTNHEIKELGHLSKKAESLLNDAARALGLSARSYMRVIKVARTIADLDGNKEIYTHHIAEALQYRSQTAPFA